MTAEIAIVRWFGEHRNQNHSDYKILECEDGRMLHIHHTEIKCTKESLKRGRFVTFERQGNEVKNLQLFREVGVIDWFNDEKGFGCAILKRNDITAMFESRNRGTAEVFIHEMQIKSTTQNFKKGTLVVFEVRRTYQTVKDKLRDNAVNINLLAEETNLNVLERCVSSEDADCWLPIFNRYLSYLKTTDDKVTLATQKINKILTNLRQQFANSLPEEVLAESLVLRNYLPINKHIDVIVALIKKTQANQNYLNILLNELHECIKNIPPTSEVWNKIPENILLQEIIWSVVPLNHRLSIFIKQLNEQFNYENTIHNIANLLNSCSVNKRQLLISQIPDKVKSHELILPFLPVNEQVDIIAVQIQNSQNHNYPLEFLLVQLKICLQKLDQYSHIWSQIPTNILLDQQIWPLVPASRQFYIILDSLEEPSTYENGIDKLTGLLSGYTYDEKIKLINRIPVNAKKHYKIINFLPINEQLEALAKLLCEENLENTGIISLIETIVSQVALRERQLLISRLPDWVKEVPCIRSSLFRIPTAASRPDAPEATQIRTFVAERGINILCHFTTIENLQGICREGGLLSNPLLRNQGQQYNQIDPGRNDGRVNHLCCSINSYNSMYHYHARLRHQTKCWVLLGIRPDYLWKQGTLFCRINAASASGGYIKEGFAALQSMFAPKVTDVTGKLWTRQGLSDALPTCVQAEILVYESICLDDVILIWVNEDPGNEQMVREAGWKGKICVLRGLFKS